jgi:hypothetical protein
VRGRRREEKVSGSEYDRSILYTCMKIAHGNPPKTVKK